MADDVKATLDAAVEDAAKAHESNENAKEGSSEKPAESSTETKTAEELSAEQIDQAKQLFKALQDPEKAHTVVKFLAQEAGLLNPPETKQEVKEQKKEIVDYLKENLGEGMEFLADKLAPAIEKILADRLPEYTRPLEEKFSNAEQEKLTTQALATQKELAKEFFNANELPEAYLNEMTKVMDRLKPDADNPPSVDEYVRDVFDVAHAKLSKARSSQQRNEKNGKNSNDAHAALASGRGGNPKTETVAKPMNLDEAIAAAAAALEEAG